jgi:hypothetical protein
MDDIEALIGELEHGLKHVNADEWNYFAQRSEWMEERESMVNYMRICSPEAVRRLIAALREAQAEAKTKNGQ